MGFKSTKPKPMGRPLTFKSEKELKIKINEYFEQCKNNVKHISKKTILTINGETSEKIEEYDESDPLIPSIAGLAYYIGIDRHTLYDYEEKQNFYHTIKAGRDKVLNDIENGLLNCKDPSAGKIFLAKNYGYKDKTEQEITVSTDEESKKKLKEIFNANS